MQVACHGRLGQDPREITTSTGKTMAAASIAVALTDRQGSEHTEWLGIIAFGKTAEMLLKHSKGDMVSVSGRVQRDSYTNSSGESREQLQVIADSLVSARTVRPSDGRKRSEAGKGAERSSRPRDDGMPFDDAIPF